MRTVDSRWDLFTHKYKHIFIWYNTFLDHESEYQFETFERILVVYARGWKGEGEAFFIFGCVIRYLFPHPELSSIFTLLSLILRLQTWNCEPLIDRIQIRIITKNNSMSVTSRLFRRSRFKIKTLLEFVFYLSMPFDQIFWQLINNLCFLKWPIL